MASRRAQDQSGEPHQGAEQERIRALHRRLQHRRAILPLPKYFPSYLYLIPAATLPHEKFYNMDAYEKRMDAMRSGQTLTLPDDGYDPNADMRALAGARKKKASEAPSYLSRDQLEELRKVQNERVQVRAGGFVRHEICLTLTFRSAR